MSLKSAFIVHEIWGKIYAYYTTEAKVSWNNMSIVLLFKRSMHE